MSSTDHSDSRWDMHSDRQIAASKAGTTAVTVLNSGSWLALLSQAGELTDTGIGLPIFFWGLGAFLGTLIWLFIYRGTRLQMDHDFDRDNETLWKKIATNIRLGTACAVASLASFLVGVVTLSCALL